MAGFDINLYEHLLRRILFCLPAEQAQKVVGFALKRDFAWGALAPMFRSEDHSLGTKFCEIPLANPIGLAAGFDKNCEMLSGLESMGFGYLTCGTVTETPHSGNPKPRMLRLVSESSLINALGFPNKGVESCANQLEKFRNRNSGTPVIISISGTIPDQIMRCHRRLEHLVDAVEVNISSPNTSGLRAFHVAKVLHDLLEQINEVRNKPLIVKMPPYDEQGTLSDPSPERVLSLVKTCLVTGVDAITISNSWPTVHPGLSSGKGGLSGKAIFEKTLRIVKEIKSEVGTKIDINACGGIFTGDDAWKLLKAGATTIQLYTGLVYRGPSTVKHMKRELKEIMEREGVLRLNRLG